MNIQNSYIRDYINKHKKEGTREETNNLIMQWIEKYAEQFRNDLIAGDYDKIIIILNMCFKIVISTHYRVSAQILKESNPAKVPLTEQLSHGGKLRLPL